MQMVISLHDITISFILFYPSYHVSKKSTLEGYPCLNGFDVLVAQNGLVEDYILMTAETCMSPIYSVGVKLSWAP